jgi:hypoxanthine-DNA glycosylase
MLDVKGVTRPVMKITSFPPVGSENPLVLILGSMPGEASLTANQYYAHPRNAFWPIMGKLFGGGLELPYTQRLEILSDHRIGLWESLKSCVRIGSLDSAITDEIPNNFKIFLKKHSEVTHIFFNGAKAEYSFRRYVLPTLDHPPVLHKLPSTSPAHAGMSFENKLKEWGTVRDALAGACI